MAAASLSGNCLACACGETTQAELLDLIGIEQPTMAFTLRRMERDGIIERSPDPEHGRKSLVKLTARAARDPATPGPDLRL